MAGPLQTSSSGRWMHGYLSLMIGRGDRRQAKYKRTGSLIDLEKAIESTQDEICVTSTDDSYWPWLNYELGNLLYDKFRNSGDPTDIDKSIQATHEAIASWKTPLESLALVMTKLADRVAARYKLSDSTADLDEEIQIRRKAISTASHRDQYYGELLNFLASTLNQRYQKAAMIDDMEEAIVIGREALVEGSHDDLHRTMYLTNLGKYLHQMYVQTKTTEYLDESIQLYRTACSISSSNGLDHSEDLRYLSGRLYERFGVVQNMDDLEEAISFAKTALDMMPSHGPDRLSTLLSLRSYLQRQHARTGSSHDLDEAIRIGQAAARACPLKHAGRENLLVGLSTHLQLRYHSNGKFSDFEEGVTLIREVVDAVPAQTLVRVTSLLILAGLYLFKSGRTWEVADGEACVRFAREAVDAAPVDSPLRENCFFILAAAFGQLYFLTRAIADLEAAISTLRAALGLDVERQSLRLHMLALLGDRLSDLYKRTSLISDLDEAINAFREAVNIDGFIKGRSLPAELGYLLMERYARRRLLSDLQEATLLYKEVSTHFSEDPGERATGIERLEERFMAGQTTVLDRMQARILAQRKSVEETPELHPRQAIVMTNLGGTLFSLYASTTEEANIVEAKDLFLKSLRCANSPIIDRVSAGVMLQITHVGLQDWQGVYECSEELICLVPALVARSLETSDKQYSLASLAGIAPAAAGAALEIGLGPEVALTLLEKARAVLVSSIDELRADLSDLEAQQPKLASEFLQFQRELEEQPAEAPSLSSRLDTSWSTRASKRREAEINMNKLIAEIRSIPGFEDFMSSELRPEHLQEAASAGPIVVVNPGPNRSDAIIVERHQIRSIPLKNLDFEDIGKMRSKLSRSPLEVLEWLWDAIAEPVLQTLEFVKPPLTSSWPRIWWIPVAELSGFPLQAAGRHGVGSTDTVLDRVISSYSPSIKAIIKGRQRQAKAPISSTGPHKALLVAMRHTPQQIEIPYATQEISMIRNACTSLALKAVEPPRRKKDILSSITDCKIFHFAGHGLTDNRNPSQSYLLLEDWQITPLTVANLFEVGLFRSSPFLAYLSACGTGRVKASQYYDESLHLISAFQLAGFRNVVGTLWEVNDNACKDVATILYDVIIREGMTDDSVCLGLHEATRQVRQRWLDDQRRDARNRDALDLGRASQVRNTGVDAENAVDRLARDFTLKSAVAVPTEAFWVPFVHYGV